jgi:hypothetical protein
MTRLVREFIEVRDHVSLDELIVMLHDLRAALPASANPDVRMRGDDVFGRHLSISYLRPQTGEEAASDARYLDIAPVSLAA